MCKYTLTTYQGCTHTKETVSFCSLKLTTMQRPCSRVEQFITSQRACKKCRQSRAYFRGGRFSRALKKRLSKTVSMDKSRRMLVSENGETIFFSGLEIPEDVESLLAYPVDDTEDSVDMPNFDQRRGSAEQADELFLSNEEDARRTRRDRRLKDEDKELFLGYSPTTHSPCSTNTDSSFKTSSPAELPTSVVFRKPIDVKQPIMLSQALPISFFDRYEDADKVIFSVKRGVQVVQQMQVFESQNSSPLSNSSESAELDSRNISKLSHQGQKPSPKPSLSLIPAIRRLSSFGDFQVSPLSPSEWPMDIYELPVSPITPEAGSKEQGIREPSRHFSELDGANIFASFLGSTNVEVRI